MGQGGPGTGHARGDGAGRRVLKPSAWLEDLAGFLLPAGCLACGIWIPGGASAPLVCGRCRSLFAASPWPRCPRCHFPTGTGRPPEESCRACREWRPELFRARHAYTLRPPVSDVVHALKYEGWAELAPLMAAALARAYRPPPGRAVITYVPTTRSRERVRGYNQARLLAEAYARELDMPVVRLLSRERGAASQTTLHPAERVANVAGAFVAEPATGSWRGVHVVLVDDVLTTGATACEAARTLAGAGTGPVTLLTFARALPAERRTGR